VQLNASDGFVINEAVTITVIDILGIATDSVSITSIATLTMDTPELTAGVEGTITGTSNGDEVDVLYSPAGEDDWTAFEEGVAVTAGAWTATGTIADAGTYDIKVTDGTDSDAYDQQDSIVVASGEVLTALQITNASDAVTKAHIFVKETKLVGDNILVFCITKSSKIKIGATFYPTGLGTTNASGRCFIASITKNHTVNWISFYDWDIFSETSSGNIMLIDGDYLFTVDQYKPSSRVVSRLNKITLSDGSVSSISLTAIGGEAAAYNIGGIYDNDIIIGGRDLAVTYGRSVFWKVKTDLSGQAVYASGFSGSYNAYKFNSYVAFNTHIFSNDSSSDMTFWLIDPSSSWGSGSSSSTDISYISRINIGDMISSASRVLFFISAASTVVGTRLVCCSVSDTTLTQKWYNHFSATQELQGRAIFDGTNFTVVHRIADDGDGRRQFTIRKIADSDSYTEVEVVDTFINSGDNTIELLYGCGFDVDSDHYVIAGQVTGAFESGFTVGDNTKKDVWIKLIEK
jgi:hypothetical protein